MQNYKKSCIVESVFVTLCAEKFQKHKYNKTMKSLESLLAEKLLKISAIKLQPEIPFTWASGWNSPIYTDNRKTLSYPEVRSFIKIEMCLLILENFEKPDAIAGVATLRNSYGRSRGRRSRTAICLCALVAQGSRPGKSDRRQPHSRSACSGDRGSYLYRRQQPEGGGGYPSGQVARS